ncbi:hypothetical protein VE02_01795 [Pseudogymnoascus sp. 03VT05]|nr:hypothetical protein VE02_01795 [Pseudogymnoascus sp. 03VT05]
MATPVTPTRPGSLSTLITGDTSPNSSPATSISDVLSTSRPPDSPSTTTSFASRTSHRTKVSRGLGKFKDIPKSVFGKKNLSSPSIQEESIPIHEKNGIWELTDPCEDEDGFMDVVAVHGLQGDWKYTWEDDSKNWLRDFLPTQVQQLRILSFGYDSSIAFSSSTPDLRDLATKLLNTLGRKRDTSQEKKRPILFICHSLGGIILKQAMIIANERASLHAWFLEHIKGVVFMGTPHLGSEHANWASFFANLLEVTIGPTTNTALLASLKIKAPALIEICHQFPERASKLKILSFYELGICNGLRHRIVERESAILGRENERMAGVDADHMAMCKFARKESQKYQEVFGLVRNLIRDIREDDVSPRDSIHFDRKDSREILASLFDTHVSNRASAGTRVEGTCQWILTNPEFSLWNLSNDDSPVDTALSLLWITGAPGTGKSILTTFVVDQLRNRFPGASISSFSFDNGKRPIETLLRSVLHNLLSSNPKLLPHAAKEWQVKGKSFSTDWETLCEIWSQCCLDLNGADTIWVIDALDECEEYGRIRFLQQLAKVVRTLQSVGNTSRFKVFFTSRLEKDIQDALSGIRPLRINLDDEVGNLTLDITKVIDKGIKDLTDEGVIPLDKADLLKQRLFAESDKTFLWVTLILGLLRTSELLPESLESIIRDLPAGLDSTYRQLLAQVPEKQQPSTKVVLQLIMAANKPLNVREMNLLLKVQGGHSREQDLRPLFETLSRQIQHQIQHLYGSFIRIIDTGDGDKHVHFVHKSASEFLLAENLNKSESQGELTPKPLWYAMDPIAAHAEIAKRCIWVLKLIGTSSKSLEKWQGHGDFDFDVFVRNFLEDHDMYEYAAVNWASHLHMSEATMTDDILFHALRLYRNSGIYTTWSQIFWALQLLPQPHNYSAFHMTAYNGHAKLLDKLLDDDDDETTKDSKSEGGDAIIHIAADRGHPKVIRVLKKYGADFTIRDKIGLTALHRAVKANHLKTVAALIEAGSSVDSRKQDGSTALHLAASEGNCEMIELLVEKGSTVQATNQQRKTAADLAFNKGHGEAHRRLQNYQVDHGVTDLDQAIIEGNLSEVQSLVDSGADLTLMDDRGSLPLHHAARENHLHIVKFLLERNVGRDIEDENGLTALHLAARRGRTKIVELLLKYDAKIDAKSKDGSTSLHEAASGGSEEVVQLLLQQKESEIQRVNRTNDEGKTALNCAAAFGFHLIAQSLISRGASTETRDRDGRSPLHQASSNGHIEVLLELFKSSKVDVNCIDLKGATPLTLAARGTSPSHGQVVKLLLEKGADPKWAERDKSTPILLAAESGNILSMEYLLKKGVNPDERNTLRYTPLGIAAAKDHEEAVLLLLDNDAKDVSQNSLKRPPLSWSSEHGHLRAVKRLLKFEAVDVDISGNDERRTPLSYAAANGHLAVVRCLIQEANPTIDFTDHEDRTPLSWAAGGGHVGVASLLLENGADQCARDLKGRAPISWAAINGSFQLLKAMIDREGHLPESTITNNGKTLLALACENGHESIVRFLLSRGKGKLNRASKEGFSPLHLAASNGHDKIVDYILSLDGIDVHLPSKMGYTAFSSAVQGGHFQVAQNLIRFDPSVLDTETIEQKSPLIIAVEGGHSDMVSFLLSKGVDPNFQNQDQETPIFLAALRGDLVTVNVLLSDSRVRFDLEKTNKAGVTPLLAAACYGHLPVVKSLTKHAIEHDLKAMIKQKDQHSFSPLSAAVFNGHPGVVDFLFKCEEYDPMEHRNNKGSLLILSLISTNKEVIKMILSRRSELDVPDKSKGRTPLLWAAYLGDEDTIKFLLFECTIVRNATDFKDSTAIYLAARNGHELALKLLLENGIGDINAPESEMGSTPLIVAAKNGHSNIVALLLQQEGIQVNQQDNHGCTAFLWAVREGHEFLVRKLSEDSRVECRVHDSKRRSALSWASEKGYSRIVQMLINLDLREINDVDIYGSNPLWFAASCGWIYILENLLMQGSSSTVASGPHRRTPLMQACNEGHFSVVERLCQEKDPGIHLKDLYGYTALSLAAKGGHEQIVIYLLNNGADPNTQATKSKRTPLMEAAMVGSLKVFRALTDWPTTDINLKNDADRTALWFAINYRNKGYDEMVYILLRKNVQTNVTDLDDVTYLMLAARNITSVPTNEPILQKLLDLGKIDPGAMELPAGSTALMKATIEGCAVTVKQLLQHPTAHVNADQGDFDNMTPLAIAAINGYSTIVRMLLDCRVTVDSYTLIKRETPLMFAANNGKSLVVDQLIAAGANVNATDKTGATALFGAATFGCCRTIRQLLANGAISEVRSKTGLTALHLAAKKGRTTSVRFLSEKIPVTVRDHQGRTPMSYAAEAGQDSVVRYLLSLFEGSEFEVRDSQHKTPLTWATIGGNVELVSLMLNRGAKKDILDRNGRSLVSHAAEKGHLAVMHHLISEGSNVDTQDNAGRAALSWAAGEGHLSVVRCLLDNGADPNQRDKKGQLPQIYAANNEKKQVVELLRRYSSITAQRKSSV